jgi:hypothetical protein
VELRAEFALRLGPVLTARRADRPCIPSLANKKKGRS